MQKPPATPRDGAATIAPLTINRDLDTRGWRDGDTRAGEILLADSMVFSTLFGADGSVKRFWKNLVTAT